MAKIIQTKSILQKKLEEDVLMASKVGDAVWLQQSLSTTKIALDFTDQDGLSAIHLTALECQFGCLKILVEKQHIDVNLASEDGWTPLHLAINNSMAKLSLTCVNYLLSHGADPSSASSFGLTPMHQAAACGNVNCLKALISAGGLLDGIDETGHSPLGLAILWAHRECARILKHYQWQKDKAFEDIEKNEMKLEEEQSAGHEIAAKIKEKSERRLKGQKAYQLWLAKNQFTNNNLFGLGSILNLNDGGESKRSLTKQSSKNSKVYKMYRLPNAALRDTDYHCDKKVNLIPIKASESPEAAKHLAHMPSPARIRALRKIGPLEFTVV